MTAVALTEQGYRLLTATNGAEALVLLEKCAETINLVLLDQEMPVMDGHATLIAIQARWPQIPVLLMSGQASTQDNRQSLQLTQIETISKPFRLEELLHAVSRSCRAGNNLK